MYKMKLTKEECDLLLMVDNNIYLNPFDISILCFGNFYAHKISSIFGDFYEISNLGIVPRNSELHKKLSKSFLNALEKAI